MNTSIAKNKILDLYKSLKREDYENMSKQEYKEIFYAVNKYLPSKDRTFNIASKPFLYYGALKFCKFSIPGDFVYSDDDYHFMDLLASKFSLIESDDRNFSPIICLYKLKWDLYNEINLRSSLGICTNKYKQKLDDLQITESNIRCNPGAYSDLVEQKNKLYSLLNGIEANTLKTKIKTRLPYRLVKNNSSITICKDDIKIKISLDVKYLGNLSSMFQPVEGQEISTEGSPRWQSYMTEIEIETDCLVDDSKYVMPLVFSENMEVTGSWNNLYDFTYTVVEKLWWNFISSDKAEYNHIPSPKDIPTIEYTVWSGEEQLEFKVCSNPALIFTIAGHAEKVNDLGRINWEDEIPLYDKCLYYAKSNMELGLLKESIFWLNVAAESLIYALVEVVAPEDLKSKLLGEIDFFAEAKEIVAARLPKYKDQIVWPCRVRHRSAYNLVKSFCQVSPIPMSEKDTTKLFSKINSKRNKLFHGESNDINIIDVKKAYDSYMEFSGIIQRCMNTKRG